MTIKIIIADDHPVFREGLRSLLSIDEALEIAAEASDGEEAVKLAMELRPDVVLMDIQMPVMNGIDAAQRIVARLPGVRVLMLTMYDDDDSVFKAMRAGARGYILKGARPEEVIRAVRATADGEAIFSPSIAVRFIEYFQLVKPAAAEAAALLPELTERELEILGLIAKGMKNAEIASSLYLSPKTVRNHISNILSKLQVANRAEAILRARDAGLGT
ncbi:response regulator transcription factor [Paenibacillus sp.]|uniref:response regulator transcription factor n=1 Tax=Paenibacillus sp. TaxID=58172 RepID=UPI002D72C500|nr:response regulator transcription factor [Paenibacillus sp.]HZG84243.1 response regulator transcription factor [Paenibacillus sp.]